MQRTQGRWLGSILVELGTVGPEEIVQVLSNHLGLRSIDLDQLPANVEAVRALPESMARRFGVVPVSQLDSTLHVAMVNPMDTLACDLIQARTGMRLERVVATERSIRAARGSRDFG